MEFTSSSVFVGCCLAPIALLTDLSAAEGRVSAPGLEELARHKVSGN